jgi:hypothetical protein
MPNFAFVICYISWKMSTWYFCLVICFCITGYTFQTMNAMSKLYDYFQIDELRLQGVIKSREKKPALSEQFQTLIAVKLILCVQTTALKEKCCCLFSKYNAMTIVRQTRYASNQLSVFFKRLTLLLNNLYMIICRLVRY